MATRSRILLATILVAITSLTSSVKPAHAQCNGLTMWQSGVIAAIDEAVICAAAQPFINAGFQVYVATTDRDPATEDEWFAIRDNVEGQWGIYNAAEDTFAKGAVAVELTTVTSHPWGQDLAFGEYLFGTPLDNDAVIGQIEGALKNTVATGDVQGAIVNALTTAYNTAFPPSTAVPPTAIPITPVVVEGPTTNVNVDVGPVLRFFGGLLTLLALAVLGFLAVTKVILPAMKEFNRVQNMRRQAISLKAILGKLLNTSSKVLQGENPESTLVYSLWKARGGPTYPDRDRVVRENLRRAQTALAKIFQVWRTLPPQVPGTEVELKKYVAQLETLVLTLVGRSPRILSMTEAELMTLLDPSLSIPREEADEAAVVAQVEALAREHDGAGRLKLTFLVVRPESVDQEGILGYLDQAKTALNELTEAKEKGPLALAKVKAERGKLASGVDGSTFKYPDTLIKQAEDAAKAERWLEVKALSDQALDALAKSDKADKIYSTGLNQHKALKSEADRLSAKGYRSEAATTAMAETLADVREIQQAFESGNYARVEEYSRELVSDTERAVKVLRELEELYKKNQRGLVDLSARVAKIEQYRRITVEPAWAAIQKYPRSNWATIADHFGTATSVLISLMDDPANPKDLASEIEEVNGMKQQNFAQAEKMLVSANNEADTAEAQLKAIVAQLERVQSLEKSLALTVPDVEGDIRTAVERRDRDDQFVDSDVDGKIAFAQTKLSEAKKALEGKEFTTAKQKLDEARELARLAGALAAQQVADINALFADIRKLKEDVPPRVRTAQTEQARLTPAAQKASTAGLVHKAEDQLHQAEKSEAKVNGLQDKRLAVTLTEVKTLYSEAGKAATTAIERIRADKNAYDGYVSNVQSAISSAQSAISSAGRYVRDSDASGAGRHTLSRAESMLPGAPSYGDTQDALDRRRRQAQEAQEEAERAESEARRRIRMAEDARAEERRRREAEEAARRAAEERRRSSYSSSSYGSGSSSSSSHSSSWGSSSRSSSSSFGSSSHSHSSSMGSSHRR